ncbi:hypothetical protein AKO1_006884 [Acrasis kona]|uniref:Transcription factor CBF/NF-Y/archaeal histone domain-containing protein n=1 Tax=Acrasis kona TaxID=1008807 RepID=A0AAW2YUJ5_9EUKA
MPINHDASIAFQYQQQLQIEAQAQQQQHVHHMMQNPYYPNIPPMPSQLHQQLQHKLQSQFMEIESTKSFKNHELPLARIKKIMKSDEDVRIHTGAVMISAEAPIIFAKACEMFIIELTTRSWVHTDEAKRRTLQRNDIAAAIAKTDVFDFLIDIVPEDGKTNKKDAREGSNEQHNYMLQQQQQHYMQMQAQLEAQRHHDEVNSGQEGVEGAALTEAAVHEPHEIHQPEHEYHMHHHHMEHPGQLSEEEESEEDSTRHIHAQHHHHHQPYSDMQPPNPLAAMHDPNGYLNPTHYYLSHMQQFQNMNPQIQQMFLQQNGMDPGHMHPGMDPAAHMHPGMDPAAHMHPGMEQHAMEAYQQYGDPNVYPPYNPHYGHPEPPYGYGQYGHPQAIYDQQQVYEQHDPDMEDEEPPQHY